MKKCSIFLLALLLLALFACAPADLTRDGQYTVEVALSGGSGRASISSPAKMTLADGKMTAEIIWSSPHYDYMLVDGKKYLPINTDGNSVFEIPITALDQDIAISAETTAMSQPHMIGYTLRFDSATLKAEGTGRRAWIILAITGGVGITVAVIILSSRKKRRQEIEQSA